MYLNRLYQIVLGLMVLICPCGFVSGFEFSDIEPSALVQRQGGPCAVLAPVQAFLLKTIIMETHGHSLGDVSFCSILFYFVFFF